MNDVDRIISEAKEAEVTLLSAVIAIMAVILLAFGLWVLPRPADAAVKVQVRYDIAAAWNVPAAVKAAPLSTSAVRKTGAATVADCDKNCVVVFDVPDRFEYTCDGFPTTKLRSHVTQVCRWSPNSATVMVSTAASKGLTASQRHAYLTAALRATR